MALGRMGVHDRRTRSRDPMSHTIDVRVRRRPKYSVFMGVGVVLGLIVAPLLAMQDVELINPNEEYSFLAVAGFLGAVLGITGLILGAAVALIIERVSARRHRDFTVPAYYERTGTRPDAPAGEPEGSAAVESEHAPSGDVTSADGTAEDTAATDDHGADDPAAPASRAEPEDHSKGK